MDSNLERLRDTFEKMKAHKFDFQSNLKWGFFFIDNEKSKLLSVFNELKDCDYKLEELEQIDEGLWQLYITKVDLLTPEKLHKRNLSFNELANFIQVNSYSGWDVEKM